MDFKQLNEKLQKYLETKEDKMSSGNYNIRITNIKWDTDNDDINLPTKVNLKVEHSVGHSFEEEISNTLSDKYGYCHYGFDYRIGKNLTEYMGEEGDSSIYDNEDGYDILVDEEVVGKIEDLDELDDWLFDNDLTLKDIEIMDSYTGYYIPKDEL